MTERYKNSLEMTPVRESARLRSERDSAALLYDNAYGGIAVSFVASTVLAFVFSGSLSATAAITWWSAQSIVLLFRLIDVSRWHKSQSKILFDGARFKRRFSYGVVATGLVWAAFPIIAFEYLEILDMASTMIVLAAMAGGATTVLSSSRGLSIYYGMCLLLPMSLSSIFLSDNTHVIFLGALGVVFWLVIFGTALKASDFTSKAVSLNNQNQDLLEEMRDEQRAIQSMHTELNHAYGRLHEVNENLEQKIADRTLELEQLATTDTLTGLLNRQAFVNVLKSKMGLAKARDKKLAVFFVDLDGFKDVNDLKGHLLGDELLINLAQRFDSQPTYQNQTCRWGGDEFILMAEVLCHEDAMQKAEELHAIISEPFEVQYDKLWVGATIGIALYPDHEETPSGIIQAADMAMYSKKRGLKGGPTLYDPDMLSSIQHNQAMKVGLREAIDRDELSLVYQPIIPKESSTPACFEALVRWKHDGVDVTPVEFIPVAESSGYIIEIGSWILHQACADAMKWDFSPNIKVAVNVSVRQLLEEHFLLHVESALTVSGLPPKRLLIEVTESVFAEDKETISLILDYLRRRGITVSIDDFGTGFSSLSYLQALPVDEVKIDQAFVREIDGKGQEIVKATVSIAKAFGCNVIAEGVEREDEQDKLIELGVDLLQGFYYSKPMSADQVAAQYS